MTPRISRLASIRTIGAVLALSALLTLLPSPATAQLVRSASGIGSAAAQVGLDQFRLDLGGGNVAGANGSFGGVRREINWDGVPASFAAPNNLPSNFFNTNSPRGVVFSTPGTGFQVSGATGDGGAGQPAAGNFANINPSYSSVFSPYSAQRLFTPIGSNILDVTFFVAGTNTAGLTRGFGSIFSDVDLANISSIEFFGAMNNSLGSFFVPNFVGATAPHLSFLGVSFAAPVVSRVRITAGTAALSAFTNDLNGNPTDLVVMDDFLYGEVVSMVPEPPAIAMLAFGLLAVALGARRRAV